MGTYRTIVADPPWEQKGGPAWDGRGEDTAVARNSGTRTNSRTRPLPYPPMSVEEIAGLPVEPHAADDAHLYIWVTNRYVEQVFNVARAWGFKPVSLLTWCKPPMGKGLGGAYVQTTEFILFARRGKEVRLCRSDTSWWEWSRVHGAKSAIHSAKPDAFLDKVEQVSPAPRLELFARRSRLGWERWGNEVDSTIDLGAAA